jgi:hypothetical protein
VFYALKSHGKHQTTEALRELRQKLLQIEEFEGRSAILEPATF